MGNEQVERPLPEGGVRRIGWAGPQQERREGCRLENGFLFLSVWKLFTDDGPLMQGWGTLACGMRTRMPAPGPWFECGGVTQPSGAVW